MPLLVKKLKRPWPRTMASNNSKILSLFAAPEKIDTLTVTEFVAALVSN